MSDEEGKMSDDEEDDQDEDEDEEDEGEGYFPTGIEQPVSL